MRFDDRELTEGLRVLFRLVSVCVHVEKDRISLAYALEKAQAVHLTTPNVVAAMAKLDSAKTSKLLHAIRTVHQ